MTPQEILALPMTENDADAATVRDYLKQLLLTLWDEEDGFSGKRPFGNSGWKYEVFDALVRGGAVPGKQERYGERYDADDFDVADAAVRLAIGALR